MVLLIIKRLIALELAGTGKWEWDALPSRLVELLGFAGQSPDLRDRRSRG